ncbi:MAG: uroporphyrinogen-III synthase [Pseudoflavonifractor sp.]|nr:uroporphyrinogen-III synthase [Alloprevotella sp.]MCM1116917.1 uroporphyrinogen-III synthase [Pseudoflavonifractor sp.]
MSIKKILISQPKATDDRYAEIAAQYGVDIVFRPFIKVEGLSAKEFRQQKISIPEFTAIIFTAKTSIDHFFRLCEEMRIVIPETMKYFCTSEQIANYLQKYIVYRKRRVFFGQSGKLDDPQLKASLQRHSKERFLFAVSDIHRDSDSAYLDSLGIKYTKAVMYRTVSNDFGPDEAFDYDMLIFFSPAGIESLMKNFPSFDQGEIVIACLGPKTAKAVEDAGLRLDFLAGTIETPSIVSAIEKALKAKNA